MNEDLDLKVCMHALAESEPQDASPAVQQHLLVRFRERRARRLRIYAAGTATFVITVLVLCTALWHSRNTPQDTRFAIVDQASGFITLPYGQSGVPLEQPVIVRIDIPISQLGAMGVQVRPPGATGFVKADLLVGQDGVARAVRFVE
jgi:hypothetical protein